MHERVFVGGAPFLGICVGMQLLASQGLEHGETPGLGWIAGTVRLIEPADRTVKVPHMGWNDVATLPHTGSDGIVEAGEAYFLHSYHFKPRHHADGIAMTDHGGGLVAAVGRANMLGVQSIRRKPGIACAARSLSRVAPVTHHAMTLDTVSSGRSAGPDTNDIDLARSPLAGNRRVDLRSRRLQSRPLTGCPTAICC